jgi:hypothetical protein
MSYEKGKKRLFSQAKKDKKDDTGKRAQKKVFF